MTTGGLSARLRTLQALLTDPALRRRMQTVAALEVQALVKRRVYNNGEATDGSSIGTYSTKEGWFSSPPGLRRVPGKSKVGRKGNKTYYAARGYAEFREAAGRQSGKVDLSLTGGTGSEIKTGLSRGGQVAFGIGTRRAADICEGHEMKYVKLIYSPNESERNAAFQSAKAELNKVLGI